MSEQKFIVLKIDDIEKHCSEKDKDALTKTLIAITTGRIEEGKSVNNEYLVVNTDEPYADDVRKIIKENEGECLF